MRAHEGKCRKKRARQEETAKAAEGEPAAATLREIVNKLDYLTEAVNELLRLGGIRVGVSV